MPAKGHKKYRCNDCGKAHVSWTGSVCYKQSLCPSCLDKTGQGLFGIKSINPL